MIETGQSSAETLEEQSSAGDSWIIDSDPEPRPLPVIFRGHSEAGFFAHGVQLGRPAHPLQFLPGNQPSLAERYACFVVLNDFGRLSLAQARATRGWHFSQIEEDIQNDVREGRAVLVFDLSNEGPRYDPGLFREIYSWLAERRLPAARCIWLAQNRAMEASAALDAGAPVPGMRFVHYDFFVKVVAELFSPQGSADGLQQDPAIVEGQLFDPDGKTGLVLSLNATPRLQRVLAVAALKHHGLLDQSLVSFPGLNYVKQGSSVQEVRTFLERESRLAYLRPAAEAVMATAELRVDNFEERGNDLVGKIDVGSYVRSYFSLVSESDFSDGSIDRITEKTVKAFCMGHPALVLGNPHSLRFARALGFHDWDGLLDRRADAIEDPATRFAALIAEVQRQVAMIRKDHRHWLDAAREVGRFNFRYATSGAFLQNCLHNLDDAALRGIREVLG